MLFVYLKAINFENLKNDFKKYKQPRIDTNCRQSLYFQNTWMVHIPGEHKYTTVKKEFKQI